MPMQVVSAAMNRDGNGGDGETDRGGRRDVGLV